MHVQGNYIDLTMMIGDSDSVLVRPLCTCTVQNERHGSNDDVVILL